MLYITTRNNTDAFTHPRTLTDDRASDGGFYTPFHLPVFSPEQLSSLKNCSFNDTVAKVLNIFFNCGLDAGDVDFAIGRVPVRILPIKYRMIVCETWHNTDSDYAFIAKQLCVKICPEVQRPSAWMEMAVRIAVYFGIYAQLLAQEHIREGDTFDVAVSANCYVDMSAVHYARKMGLPVGMMICGCKDDILWNLMHRGELPTKNLSFDAIDCVEHFLYCKLGCRSVREFVDCCENGNTYCVSELQRGLLSDGMYTSVVTDNRVDAVISSVYKTNSYVIDSQRVLPYAALQDYRTKAGESKFTLFCADKTPVHDCARVCAAAGITPEQLSSAIN